jgi:AraC family ethanolamine operon transcriptional activator
MRFVQTGGGALDGQVRILQDTDLTLMHLYIGAPSIMTSISIADLVVIGIQMPNQNEYIYNGKEINRKCILISSVDEYFTTKSDFRDIIAIGFSRVEFMRDLSYLLGATDIDVSELPRMIRCSQFNLDFLRSFVCDTLYQPPTTTENIENFKLRKIRFREVVLGLIASAIDQSDNLTPTGRPSLVVKRALDIIDTERSDKLTISSLCGSVGVSSATLYRAFVDVTGLPPSAYMKLARLSKARGLLIRDRPRRAAVKQAAIASGFSVFGRFSSDYRQLFGEKPSDTIRR